MRIRNCIGVLAAILAVWQPGTASYQKVDPPTTKAQGKQEQQVPVEFIAPEELKAKLTKNEPITIVDLRGPTFYAQSDNTIKGAIHTKVRRAVYRLREIPRDRELVTYCECPADEAAIIGARSLLANGFKRVRVLKGGWRAWLEVGGQVQPRPKSTG